MAHFESELSQMCWDHQSVGHHSGDGQAQNDINIVNKKHIYIADGPL